MPIKNVLVVDDSPTDRAVLSDILIKNHYAVLMAESGEEAITRSKQLLPDLILMDIVMPGINGFQATRTIARDRATRNIPIIICTTKRQETDKTWALRQGARDYVIKPINPAELLGKIQALA
ncbi:MAG: response regulator [Gammaproteobacteria bacterium]